MDTFIKLALLLPWLVPAIPIICIFVYYNRIRSDFETKQINVKNIEELFENVVIHLPQATFVKLEDERISINVKSIISNSDSSVLLKIAYRQESLKNRIDALTKPVFGTCLGMFVFLIILLIFILNPKGSLLSIFIMLAVFFSMFIFILLYHWDGQIRSDVEILRNHIKGTPAKRQS
jgi:hypothetical protein